MKSVILLVTLAVSSQVVRASDGDSVDTMVRAVYDVISGPAGTRDWTRFRLLFADGARMIPVRMTPEGPAPALTSVEDYITRAGASFEKNAFYESEVARRAGTFGNIPHGVSTHEYPRAPRGKALSGRSNSISVVNNVKTVQGAPILFA